MRWPLKVLTCAPHTACEHDTCYLNSSALTTGPGRRLGTLTSLRDVSHRPCSAASLSDG